jgi:hypothetical protein
MTTLPLTHPVTRADAEKVLARHVALIDTPSAPRRTLCRQVIQRFLMDLSQPGQPVIVLSESQLPRWMIQDAAGRCVTLAVRRLILLGDYLRTLAEKGLVSTDIMAAFRARHGYSEMACPRQGSAIGESGRKSRELLP